MYWTYDAAGNTLTAGDLFSHSRFEYDALHRVKTDDNDGTPGVPRHVLNYQYDERGNLTETVDQSGTRVSSTFDALNRPIRIDWNGGGVTPIHVQMDYNPRDGLSSLRRYAGLVDPLLIGYSDYRFDESGRMAELSHRDPSGAEISRFDYAYNQANELISTSDRGVIREFVRDARGQVTSVTDSSGVLESYVFDGAGNRQANDVDVSPGNRLDSDGVFDYQYDAVGNLVEKTRLVDGQVTSFSYDYRNRLTTVVIQSDEGITETVVEFVYDAFDRKIIRRIDGEAQATVYDGHRVWADFAADGSVMAKYLHGAEAVDHLLARDRPGEGTTWYLQDRLFSVRDLVDSDGKIISSIDYDSFGNITSETNPDAGDRFKFTGREWEAAIGLYDYRARHYDPKTGRFLSEDSLGLIAGDANFYRYVGNNPVDLIDPSGHVAASSYGAMVSGVIFTVVDADFSCFTESGMVFSVGVGIPYTDVYQDAYSHEAVGGGIPTPAGLDVQIMSCALLSFAAWSNGVFAQFSTVLSLLSQSESDPPRDCTLYHDVRSQGSLTDYSVFVRASCGGGTNPYYVVNNDERLEIHTGFNGDPHANCFIAGTHVLIANGIVQPEESLAETTSPTWTPVLAGLFGVAAMGFLITEKRRWPMKLSGMGEIDEFWNGYMPEQHGPDVETEAFMLEEHEPIPQCSQPTHTPLRIRPPSKATRSTSTVSAAMELAREPRTISGKKGSMLRWACAAALILCVCFAAIRGQKSETGTRAIEQAFTTSRASKPIETVRPGDTVIAWDEAEQREVPRRVLRVFRNTTDQLHWLTIAGSDGSSQRIGTTSRHPFWVMHRGWVDACDLK
ncbi:MAG: RHS repeat-associated core domain-containing protein, partial [Planctomycetota bacterium]